MRNFFRWLIYNVFDKSPYCMKCGSCGDDGCGCGVRCKGGLFCIYPHLTKRAVDEGDSAPLQAESTPEHLPIEEADTTPALRN